MGVNDDSEVFTHGILAWPNKIGHGFIDDDHLGGGLAVEVGEIAATDRGNAGGCEKAGHNVVKRDQRAAVVGIGLLALAEDSAGKAAADHAVG